MSRHNRFLVLFWVVLAAAVLTGCSKKTAGDFTPAGANARTALEAALQSWKAGDRPGAVSGRAKPAIQAVDFEWEAGLKLADFEILADEGAAGAGPRIFAVRLKPESGAPREVKYMVVGIDPLWIYRDKDYEKQAGGGGPGM